MSQFIYPEGATPIDDISELKILWVKTQKDLNRVEAENIVDATSKYLMRKVDHPSRWFTTAFLKQIHREMFMNVWDWAGVFRKFQTHPGIKPHLISSSLADLCEDVKYWWDRDCDLSIIEQAVRLHHRLVYIHPFANGNGRFSRLVSDRYLKGLGYQFPIWPIELQNNGSVRKEYLSSLRSADKGDFDPLLTFMVKCGVIEK